MINFIDYVYGQLNFRMRKNIMECKLFNYIQIKKFFFDMIKFWWNNDVLLLKLVINEL